jgi:hypothetical protein
MSGLSTGAVTGITAASVVALFLLLGLFGLLWIRAGGRRLYTATRLVPAQMTTVPDPFFLSSPLPTSSDNEASDSRPHKGQVGIPALSAGLCTENSGPQNSVRHP